MPLKFKIIKNNQPKKIKNNPVINHLKTIGMTMMMIYYFINNY